MLFQSTLEPNKIEQIEEKVRSNSFNQFMMYENLQRKYEDSNERKSKIDVNEDMKDIQSRNASMEFTAGERSYVSEAIEYQNRPKQKTMHLKRV